MRRYLVAISVVLTCIGLAACSTHAHARSAAVAAPARGTSAPLHVLNSVQARTSQTAASASVSIQPSTASVAVGATVSVDVQAAVPSPGLGAWTIEVQYDPAVLSPTGCTTPQSLTEVCNTSYSANSVLMAGLSANGISDTQTLATLTFTGQGAVGGTSALTVILDSFVDPTGTDLPGATTSDGLVTIVAPN